MKIPVPQEGERPLQSIRRAIRLRQRKISVSRDTRRVRRFVSRQMFRKSPVREFQNDVGVCPCRDAAPASGIRFHQSHPPLAAAQNLARSGLFVKYGRFRLTPFADGFIGTRITSTRCRRPDNVRRCCGWTRRGSCSAPAVSADSRGICTNPGVRPLRGWAERSHEHASSADDAVWRRWRAQTG